MAMQQKTQRKITQNAVAAGTSGALSGSAAAAGVLIICSTPISAPCVIIAGFLGGLIGMYFGKDAQSVMGAIAKGALAGAITGATVALSYVAVTKFLESMPANTKGSIKINGRKHAVKISPGTSKQGVTVTIKHRPMNPEGIKAAVTKPQHSYVLVRDNITGKQMRYDLGFGRTLPNGKNTIQIFDKFGSDVKTKGSTIIQRTIRGTGRGAKGTNRHLFKIVNKQISKVAKKSYNGKVYDQINKSCQTFASDAFNKATMGVCKGEHLANTRAVNAARAGLFVQANPAKITAAGAVGMAGPYVCEMMEDNQENEQTS